MPEQTPTRLLTPKEAARFLSISERTLSRIVKRGELPVIHVASSLRYEMDDLTTYIDRNREGRNI